MFCYRQGLIFYLKGTPSREGYKTGFSVLTTFELALPGQIDTIWKTVSPYYLFNISRLYCKCTVRYSLIPYSGVTVLTIHMISSSVFLDQLTVLVFSVELMYGIELGP
jgi:hypothetical protein